MKMTFLVLLLIPIVIFQGFILFDIFINLKRNLVSNKRNEQSNIYTKRTYYKNNNQTRKTKYRAVK